MKMFFLPYCIGELRLRGSWLDNGLGVHAVKLTAPPKMNSQEPEDAVVEFLGNGKPAREAASALRKHLQQRGRATLEESLLLSSPKDADSYRHRPRSSAFPTSAATMPSPTSTMSAHAAPFFPYPKPLRLGSYLLDEEIGESDSAKNDGKASTDDPQALNNLADRLKKELSLQPSSSSTSSASGEPQMQRSLPWLLAPYPTPTSNAHKVYHWYDSKCATSGATSSTRTAAITSPLCKSTLPEAPTGTGLESTLPRTCLSPSSSTAASARSTRPSLSSRMLTRVDCSICEEHGSAALPESRRRRQEDLGRSQDASARRPEEQDASTRKPEQQEPLLEESWVRSALEEINTCLPRPGFAYIDEEQQQRHVYLQTRTLEASAWACYAGEPRFASSSWVLADTASYLNPDAAEFVPRSGARTTPPAAPPTLAPDLSKLEFVENSPSLKELALTRACFNSGLAEPQEVEDELFSTPQVEAQLFSTEAQDAQEKEDASSRPAEQLTTIADLFQSLQPLQSCMHHEQSGEQCDDDSRPVVMKALNLCDVLEEEDGCLMHSKKPEQDHSAATQRTTQPFTGQERLQKGLHSPSQDKNDYRTKGSSTALHRTRTTQVGGARGIELNISDCLNREAYEENLRLACEELQREGRFEELASLGSAMHGRGCKPCAFAAKGVVCLNGKECKWCHLCPPGAKKELKKARARLRKTAAGYASQV
ncbi:unnamed protein product [Amoebophrya sp. A25]|nr:unnamed protein product [Amoebophrya sp. A25]|eukprot:GSA25T00021391001.1